MNKIKLVINNQNLEAIEGDTVLEVAIGGGIYIPALCAHPEGSPFACNLCLVEIEGRNDLATSCTLLASEGMSIWTDTP